MDPKQFVKDYLTFTRKEKIGLLVLVTVLLAIMLLPVLFTSINANREITLDTAWIAMAKKMERPVPDEERRSFSSQKSHNDGGSQYTRASGNTNIAIFDFDPNTLDEAGWGKLGLKNKTIQTIRNYLAKGGHFYKPVDLKKVYGLHPDEYSRLETYIRIKNNDLPEKRVEYVEKKYVSAHPSHHMVDINTADTAAFISLPGIGSKLALRIVNFRDKLGGFYSIDQVGETFGLSDSAFQKLKQYLAAGNTPVRKININTATLEELKAHPYIKYAVAAPIVAYRNEHGPFLQPDDLRKVMAVTETVFSKIAPYLSLQ